MDFSFVGSSNSLKRKATTEADQSTAPKLATPVVPVSLGNPSTQQSSTAQAAPRAVVQLPSLHQVQAAQQAQTAPNLFRASSSGQATQPNGKRQADWTNVNRPNVSLPVRPSSAVQGSGVFAEPARSNGYPQHPTSFSRQPSAPVPCRPVQQQHQQAAPTYAYARPAGSAGSSQQLASQQQAQQVNPNAIFVHKRQEGNPVLKHIRNVRWQFADIVPDYQMGQTTCAVFLSLRFHLLKPEYVHHRIKELQRSFRLRLLVCHIDVEDVVEPLGQVIKAALLNDVTLICGWSPEECARYLETYKSYETKPADAIQGRTDEDYLSKLTSAVTTVRGVNKTDVLTLGATFKTAAGVMKASMNQLAACPGIGPTKVKRLYDTFHEPFRRAPDARRAAKQAQLAFAASQDADNVVAASQEAVREAVDKVVSDGVGGVVTQPTADAVAASVQPLLEDRVLQTPLDQLDDDDPDADFELDL